MKLFATNAYCESFIKYKFVLYVKIKMALNFMNLAGNY